MANIQKRGKGETEAKALPPCVVFICLCTHAPAVSPLATSPCHIIPSHCIESAHYVWLSCCVLEVTNGRGHFSSLEPLCIPSSCTNNTHLHSNGIPFIWDVHWLTLPAGGSCPDFVKDLLIRYQKPLVFKLHFGWNISTTTKISRNIYYQVNWVKKENNSWSPA